MGTSLFPTLFFFFFNKKAPPLEISQNSTLLIWHFTWTERKGDLIAPELKRKKPLWSSVVLHWIYLREDGSPHGSSSQGLLSLFCSVRFLFKIYQVSFILDLQELLESMKTFFMVPLSLGKSKRHANLYRLCLQQTLPENTEQFSSLSWRGQGDGWQPEGQQRQPKREVLKCKIVNPKQVREKE